MMHGNEIIITRVANGFLLRLPIEYPQAVIGGFTEDQLRRQAQIMNDEINGDKILKGLQALPPLQEKGMPDPSEIKSLVQDESLFIFKTLNEVLSFIKLTYE